ncbi:MAG TPA: DUF92 domain-containing protein [Gemmatimonadaceae bacterium]|nr:DUF92 domain-containing protein [Gemmatimonadaceae bacterium]
MSDALGRAGAGLLVAAAIALVARRAHSLSTSGAVAATAVGAACVAAGWGWGGLLIAYFVVSSALSRWRETLKEARTSDVVAKGGQRDAVQVLANGGLFAAAALLSLAAPAGAIWPVAAGAGALAAAAADTWATEIGTLAGHPPRSIRTGRPVAPGTSGGVTVLGTAASIAGAGFVAALAALVGFGRLAAVGALVGGVAGSLVDSLLGATLQARRWCDRCERGTEREVHGCGTRTRPAGGVGWLDNDAVNAASALAGAALSTAVAALLVAARGAP